MKFSETLLRLRKAQGLSQETLAEKVDVSRQAVSKWETGEALPDLQKAVLLSEALGVSLDTLCGKEAAQSAEISQTPQKKILFPLLLAAICLCIGIAIGAFVHHMEPAESSALEMPDVVTVSGISFSVQGDCLAYQFVPGVAGDAYTYKISFVNISGQTRSYAVPCENGICSGKVVLSSHSGYQVTVTVSNGIEERSVSVAHDLSVADGCVTWIPAHS